MKVEFYRVIKGDYLIAVAEKLKIPPFRLISDNNLTEELYIGQVLVVKRERRELYRIKPFDTIDSICEEKNLTFMEFIRLNKTDKIYPNTLVYI